MMKTPGLSSIPWFRSISERKNARLSGHHRLNFIRFQRDVPHQIDEAIFRDEDVIFEADPQVFFPDVDARLYGKHMARFNGLVQWPTSCTSSPMKWEVPCMKYFL